MEINFKQLEGKTIPLNSGEFLTNNSDTPTPMQFNWLDFGTSLVSGVVGSVGAGIDGGKQEQQKELDRIKAELEAERKRKEEEAELQAANKSGGFFGKGGFFDNNKKTIMIIGSVIVTAIVGFFVYNAISKKGGK